MGETAARRSLETLGSTIPEATAERPPEISPTTSAVARSHLIEFPIVGERRGNLTFIEGERHIPFAIQRVYYLYDVPGGADRGGHAHRALHQVMIAMSGSFDVVLRDGFRSRRYQLNRSYYGLYIPPMTWRDLDNFSSGSVCLVLASAAYEESDYFREWSEFEAAARGAAAGVTVAGRDVGAGPEPRR